MMSEFPEVDMDSISSADQKQTYWVLFSQMKEDFIHKKDLEIILNTASLQGTVITQSGCSAGGAVGNGQIAAGKLVWAISNVGSEAKNIEYVTKATSGGAVREGTVETLETSVA